MKKGEKQTRKGKFDSICSELISNFNGNVGKPLGKCNVHKRAIMADITSFPHRADHLGRVLFEVVADLPYVLLTIARRVRTLAGERNVMVSFEGKMISSIRSSDKLQRDS